MTLDRIRENGRLQVFLGLITGTIFGFLLHRGGATEYGVILGQLLLKDFTVAKIMLSAIFVGMLGVHAMRAKGLVRLHCRRGSVGATVVGGLIFGIGFALLGYCPGTAAGAVGTGALDALVGMIGIALGAGIFAHLYPRLERGVLKMGAFRSETIPELMGLPVKYTVPAVAILILIAIVTMEAFGL